MSSPFSRETKRGTEESLEALYRTTVWASRIDTNNDVTDIDVQGFVEELEEAESALREHYIGKMLSREVDNFIVNHSEEVKDIFFGDLDTKVEVLNQLEEYIEKEFGYVEYPDLSKENLVWLVARKLKRYSRVPMEYDDENPFYEELELDTYGTEPDVWLPEDY